MEIFCRGSARNLRFSLSSRLTAVVLLPLVLQLLLFFAYAQLLRRSEQLLKAQAEASSVLEHVNWLSTQVSQKAFFSLQHRASHDDEFVRLRKDAEALINQELADLGEMHLSESSDDAAIKALIKAAQNLGVSCDTIDSGEQAGNVCPNLKTNLLAFKQAHQKVVDSQREKLSSMGNQLPETIFQLRWVVTFGLALNALLALALVRFTARNISSRVKNLSSEATRLEQAHSKSLSVKTTYEDEIDELGNSFQSMSMALNAAIEKVQEQARTDQLTGLPNRRGLLENVDSYLALANRQRKKLCVALLDIDHFKTVNDTYGHDGGDAALESVAKTFGEIMRKSDLAARWGGEEFVLVMPETDLAGALKATEKLRLEIANRVTRCAAGDFKVTVSIGVAEHGGVSDQFEQCLGRADSALYKAKRSGRNRVEAADGQRV